MFIHYSNARRAIGEKKTHSENKWWWECACFSLDFIVCNCLARHRQTFTGARLITCHYCCIYFVRCEQAFRQNSCRTRTSGDGNAHLYSQSRHLFRTKCMHLIAYKSRTIDDLTSWNRLRHDIRLRSSWTDRGMRKQTSQFYCYFPCDVHLYQSYIEEGAQCVAKFHNNMILTSKISDLANKFQQSIACHHFVCNIDFLSRSKKKVFKRKSENSRFCLFSSNYMDLIAHQW